MKEIKIIQYASSYHDDLYKYIEKRYPNRPKAYIDYCLNALADNIQGALLCLNEQAEIVGCNLCFPTKALINGGERYIAWGHDTIIDDDYRGDAGMMLMLESQSLPLFGMGLSTVNRKIQKILGTTFFDEIVVYFRLNCHFIRYIFRFLMRRGTDSISFHNPDRIQVGGQTFEEIKDASDLKIPNGGYWWKGKVNIDFIRDYDYLSRRFINNFNKYYLYHLLVQEEYDSCYFVMRPIVYKGVLALSVVDFRYDMDKPEFFSLILKAVARIAKINKIALVLYAANIGHTKPLFKHSKFSVLSLVPLLIRRNPGMDYVASSSFNLSPSITSIATGADADFDFLRKNPFAL